MKIKQAISTLLIIVLLIVVGVSVYYFVFSSSVEIGQTSIAENQTLPHGTKLNFDSVKKFNKTGKINQYPVITTNDVGQALDSIIQQ